MQSAFEIVDANKDGYVDREDVSILIANIFSWESFSLLTKFTLLIKIYVHLLKDLIDLETEE